MIRLLPDATHTILLLVGGVAAGILNTMAGGGSLLTVPLLHLAGLPGQLANGSNRIGVLMQSGTAAWRFRKEGVPGLPGSLPLFVPLAIGAPLGAYAITWVDDRAFERLFGGLMILLVVPLVFGLGSRGGGRTHRWPRWVQIAVFFAIGLYSGAFQVGVGLVIAGALNASGIDLVRANSVKVMLIAGMMLLSLPVYLSQGLVAWPHAIILGAGYAVGGVIGARLTVLGGERWLRPIMGCTVVALAIRMLGGF